MDMKKQIAEKIANILNLESVELEVPPNLSMGDYSLPCFPFAKELRKAPMQIAEDIKGKLELDIIEKVEVVAGYLNIFVKKEDFVSNILEKINEDYGSTFEGEGKRALVEHTSINPNASPHVGRARNALIGDSITRLLKFNKYDVEVHYFVNDIGKQISMLLVGTKEVKEVTFENLLNIYVDINRRVKEDPELEKEVFENLSKLESGDKETIAKFRNIVEICINGQKAIFEAIGINYDFYDYESDFIVNGDTNKILEKLKESGRLFEAEDGRLVLNQEEYNIPIESKVLVLTRGDKTSLYPLRDIAYSIHKMKRGADKNIIVLGEDQKLYYKQIQSSLDLLGHSSADVIHYSFVLLPEGKMSTRNGTVVLLEDFMSEILEKVKTELQNRSGEVDIEKAKSIAYGAVKYTILKCSNEKNVIFDLDTALSFEGDTSLYIQYNYARICSILSKAKSSHDKNYALLKEDLEIELIQKLGNFPNIIKRAMEALSPNIIANYVYDLAKTFGSYYHDFNILNIEDEDLKNMRLLLIEKIQIVIKNSLDLLGIDVVETI